MNLRSLKSIIRNRLWSFVHPTFTLSSGLQVVVENQADWLLLNEIFIEGEYDEAIELAFRFNSQSQFLFIDLGANVGYFSLRLIDLRARKGVEVAIWGLLVEGNPKTYSILDSRIATAQSQAVLHPKLGLIGSRSGTGYIGESKYHPKAKLVDSSAGGTKVPFVDLLESIPSHRTIDLIKCDIEGAEDKFIEEYQELLLKVNVLVIEWHEEITPISVSKLRLAGLTGRKLLRTAPSTCLELFWRDVS